MKMKKEMMIQWVLGVGVGTLLFGIFGFAQKSPSFLSFEKFRAPQFSLRSPSEEDRPIVEVFSVDSNEKVLSTASAVSKEEQSPSSSVSEAFRAIEPVALPNLKQEIPLTVSQEPSQSLSNETPSTPEVKKQTIEEAQVGLEQRVEELPLIFSDRSVNQLFLRTAIWNPAKRPKPTALPLVTQSSGDSRPVSSSYSEDQRQGPRSLRFRETPLEILGATPPVSQAEREENQNRINTWGQGGPFLAESAEANQTEKFKDYTQKAGDQELTQEEQAIANRKERLNAQEDPGAILAKKNKEAKEIQSAPTEDRRFRSVNQQNNLFADDGARLYAPGMKIDRFDVRIDLQNQLYYSDNYQSLPKSRGKAIDGATVMNASPSLEVAAGERDSEVTDALYVAFRYTPTISTFIDIDKREIIDHSVAFNSGFRFSKLALVVDQRITPYSGGDIESGSFISRNVYATSVSAEYEVSDKTSVELGLGNNIRDYQDGFDSQETTVRGFSNYSMTEKIRLGLGGAYGHVTSTGSSNQDYQQALVRGLYLATEKTTLFAESGYEQRQFSSKIKDQSSIVFKAGGSLALLPKTTLSVNASRNQIPSSVVRNSNTGSTGFSGSITQAVYKVKLGLTGGYEIIEFSKSSVGSPKISSYPYYNYGFSASYPITDWWNIGLAYSHRYTDKKKDSLGQNNDIESNETTLSSQIKF